MLDQLSTADRPACLDRIDPRLRVVAAVAMSVVVAVVDRFDVLAVAVAAVLIGLLLSGLSLLVALKRLLPLNAVMLVMFAVLPLTTRGETLLAVGGLDFSREGVRLAAVIALKGNVIVATLLVLLGRLDATALGHAMNHLRVPGKLSHLLLFTVRYLDVLHREYCRLRAAMKVRGFRPAMSRHTYRSFGYLAGMLLVRSFERSERIVAAMKCRGFRGQFYMLDHFHYSWRDVPFIIVSLLILGSMVCMQWWWVVSSG